MVPTKSNTSVFYFGSGHVVFFLTPCRGNSPDALAWDFFNLVFKNKMRDATGKISYSDLKLRHIHQRTTPILLKTGGPVGASERSNRRLFLGAQRNAQQGV